MATWTCKIIVKRLVHSVPDLNATDLFFEVFTIGTLKCFALWVLNLRRDGSNGKPASDRPLDCITLAFGELELFGSLA